MKKLLKFIIFILIIGALAYHFRLQIVNQISPVTQNIIKNDFQLVFPPAPCTQPIPYNLGTFDTQFGISKAYFLSALSEAEAIWDKALGTTLFVYSPADTESNVLKINLVYDYRQQATSKLNSLGITVQNNQASYDMLKVKFTAEKAQYESQKSTYDAAVLTFNTKEQAYEAEVSSWNTKGGAPQPEYDKLQAEKAELDTESAQLQAQQASLNSMVDEINALVVALNRLVAILNLSVDQYNSINGARGDTFEEGLFVEEGIARHIDIYEFSNHDKLVRVLAHELGHALGMQHVADSGAIMYKYNQGTSLTPTAADITELKTVCGIK